MYWLEISPMGATWWHSNSADANGNAPICSEEGRSSSWQEALRSAEIPRNGNTIWRNHPNKENLLLDWWGAFLSTTSEDKLSLYGSSLGFVCHTQAAICTEFSPARHQTSTGGISWNLERSKFVKEMGFEKLHLSSCKLETALNDSNAQPKPVITNHIPSLNIYRKQSWL